jgi:mRNA-degrading endonuclease RelE of RelBE toxin-antitoxin system
LTKKRIKDAIELLPSGDTKELINFNGLYRLRIGDFRIIYEFIQENVILINKIAPRGGAYKGA